MGILLALGDEENYLILQFCEENETENIEI